MPKTSKTTTKTKETGFNSTISFAATLGHFCRITPKIKGKINPSASTLILKYGISNSTCSKSVLPKVKVKNGIDANAKTVATDSK